MWYELIQQHAHHPVKLLYTTYSDYCESVRFQQWVRNEKHMECELASINTVEDYLSELADCESLISGRMHSMIFAFQYGVRIIPIPIKSKLATFKREWQDGDFDWKSTGAQVYEAYLKEVRSLSV